MYHVNEFYSRRRCNKILAFPSDISTFKQGLNDTSNRRVTILSDEDVKKKTKKKATSKKTTNKPAKKAKPLVPSDELIGKACPVCGKGHIIKGKTAYGCSCWKDGCKFVLPFNDKA